MEIDPEDVVRRRKRIDEMERDRQQALGGLKEQMKRLKDAFGIARVEDVPREVKRLKDKADKLERDYEEEVKAIEGEFDDEEAT